MVIKPLLIVAVTSFNLSVMAGGSGTDSFVLNSNFVAQHIQWMCTVGFLLMCKFAAIIRLEYLRMVTKVGNRSFEKVYSRVAALLHIWINKSFSGGFINHCVLIELLRDGAGIAGSRNILHIHLPFDAKLIRCIVRLGLPFILGRRSSTGVAKAAVNAI